MQIIIYVDDKRSYSYVDVQEFEVNVNAQSQNSRRVRHEVYIKFYNDGGLVMPVYSNNIRITCTED